MIQKHNIINMKTAYNNNDYLNTFISIQTVGTNEYVQPQKFMNLNL